MRDFKRGGFSGGGRGGDRGGFGGGRPSFGGGSRGGDRGGFGGRDSRGPVTMHQAICDQCGKTCEVPFRPTGEKPVYCNDCFGGSPKSEGRDFGRKSFGSDRPTTAAPMAEDKRIDNVQRQLDVLNSKVDLLLQTLGAKTSGAMKEKSQAPVVEAKKAVKEVAVKAKKEVKAKPAKKAVADTKKKAAPKRK